MSFYVATYDELNHGFAQEVARIGALFGASGYLQLGKGEHTVRRTDIECLKGLLPDALPTDVELGISVVAVATIGDPLAKYDHPEGAIYVLGPQTGTLSDDLLTVADDVVRVEGPVLPTDVVAGIVLRDRELKRARVLKGVRA